MNVRYINGTDTARLEFSNAEGEGTRAFNANVCVEFDTAGNLVSMTIQHLATVASLPQERSEEIDA